jgi:hypothetical protein
MTWEDWNYVQENDTHCWTHKKYGVVVSYRRDVTISTPLLSPQESDQALEETRKLLKAVFNF